MFSPAAERNKDPILEALRTRIAPGSHVLEIASGSLQHALYFTATLDVASWTPSELSEAALEHDRSIANRPECLRSMFLLDVRQRPWPVTRRFDVLYTANLLHISEALVVEQLFAGAREALSPDGRLFIYGPFTVDNAHTSSGNERFDEDLRSRNPEWGIRDQEAVAAAAAGHGFVLSEALAMPANNFLLCFASVSVRQGSGEAS